LCRNPLRRSTRRPVPRSGMVAAQSVERSEDAPLQRACDDFVFRLSGSALWGAGWRVPSIGTDRGWRPIGVSTSLWWAWLRAEGSGTAPTASTSPRCSAQRPADGRSRTIRRGSTGATTALTTNSTAVPNVITTVADQCPKAGKLLASVTAQISYSGTSATFGGCLHLTRLRWSAKRSASAMLVSIGLAWPAVGNTELPAT